VSCPSGGKKKKLTLNYLRIMACFIHCFSPEKVHRENTPFHVPSRPPFFVGATVIQQCIGMLLSFEEPEKLRDRRALQEHLLYVTSEYTSIESFRSEKILKIIEFNH